MSIRVGLQELVDAYPNMLDQLDELLLSELNAVKSKKGRDALIADGRNNVMSVWAVIIGLMPLPLD